MSFLYATGCLRNGCLNGGASPVSIECTTTSVRPKSVGPEEKASIYSETSKRNSDRKVSGMVLSTLVNISSNSGGSETSLVTGCSLVAHRISAGCTSATKSPFFRVTGWSFRFISLTGTLHIRSGIAVRADTSPGRGARVSAIQVARRSLVDLSSRRHSM